MGIRPVYLPPPTRYINHRYSSDKNIIVRTRALEHRRDIIIVNDGWGGGGLETGGGGFTRVCMRANCTRRRRRRGRRSFNYRDYINISPAAAY